MPSTESEVKSQPVGRPPAGQKAPHGPLSETVGHGPNPSDSESDRPDVKVDDVLESLHRSLRDQETVQRLLAVVKRASAVSRTVPGPSLSGGAALRRPVRRKLRRARTPLKEPRSIASARSLVSAAESLGLDLTKARTYISSSETNLQKRRSRAAAADALKAISEAKQAIDGQLQLLLPELQSRLDELRSNGCRPSSAEKGLAIAKAALKKKNFRTAIAALCTSKKALAETQTSFIRKVLLESKAKFVAAKRAGVNIDSSVRALMNAKESLRLGDLGTAIRLARRAESAVEVSMKAHRSASRALSALSRAVAIGEQIEADPQEEKDVLQQATGLFESGAYYKSEEISRSSLKSVESRLDRRMLGSIHRAEEALCLAREAGASMGNLEARIAEAKSRLTRKEYVKSLMISNSVLVDASAETITALREKLGEIGQFAKSVSGEIESLAQVQEAIVHSRERNLEMVRKYGSMSEEVVSQAYDNAAAYMRVSQDIVKQAYDSSIGIDPESRVTESGASGTQVPRTAPAQILGIASGDRKLRIIDLYLSGRIDDKQLDKLLSLVDTTSKEIVISDEIEQAQFAKR